VRTLRKRGNLAREEITRQIYANHSTVCSGSSIGEFSRKLVVGEIHIVN